MRASRPVSTAADGKAAKQPLGKLLQYFAEFCHDAQDCATLAERKQDNIVKRKEIEQFLGVDPCQCLCQVLVFIFSNLCFNID